MPRSRRARPCSAELAPCRASARFCCAVFRVCPSPRPSQRQFALSRSALWIACPAWRSCSAVGQASYRWRSSLIAPREVLLLRPPGSPFARLVLAQRLLMLWGQRAEPCRCGQSRPCTSSPMQRCVAKCMTACTPSTPSGTSPCRMLVRTWFSCWTWTSSRARGCSACCWEQVVPESSRMPCEAAIVSLRQHSSSRPSKQHASPEAAASCLPMATPCVRRMRLAKWKASTSGTSPRATAPRTSTAGWRAARRRGPRRLGEASWNRPRAWTLTKSSMRSTSSPTSSRSALWCPPTMSGSEAMA
mmetsp:Transcript_73803/g.198890  ORF Transcript_73803/g.198890 Transcript_73803/m.198890 type:complete len:302 (+) Transcript_73803:1657-2562(+)